MPDSEALNFASGFDQLMSSFPEAPGTPSAQGPEAEGQIYQQILERRQRETEDISRKRKSYLREKFAYWLVSPLGPQRDIVAEKALKEISNPQERSWLVGEVGRIAKAKEWSERKKRGEAGFWSRKAEILQKVGGSFVEGGRGLKKAFVGPDRLLGGTIGGGERSTEDRQFLAALESAKESENPYIPKDSGLGAKILTGGAQFVPDVAAGGLAAMAGGPIGMATFAGARVGAEATESMQDIGLAPGPAAAAAIPSAVAQGAIEAFINIDPTGILKKTGGPVSKFVRGKIGQAATSLAGKAVSKGAGLVKKHPTVGKATRVGADYAERVFLEAGVEEPLQATVDETIKYIAGETSEDVERRDPLDIPKKALEAGTEALPGVLGLSAGGAISSTAGLDAPQKSVSEEIREHVKDDRTPSRRTLKKWGLPGKFPGDESKKTALREIAEEFDWNEQDDVIQEGKNPTEEQWERWGLPEDSGKTGLQRAAFLKEKHRSDQELGGQMEDQERAELPPEVQPEAISAPETAPGPQEAAALPLEPPSPAQAPEIAPEQQAAPEAPVAVSPDEAADLNKEAGAAIRAELGLEQIPDQDPTTWDGVIGEVHRSGAAEKAIDMAKDVIDNRRPISDREHVSLALKTKSLLDDIDSYREIQVRASNEGNTEAYRKATKAEALAVADLDIITTASKFAGTEIGKAMSIRRLRRNREKFDIASILERAQAAKSPKGGQLDSSEQEVLTDKARELAEAENQAIQFEFQDQVQAEKAEKEAADKVYRANKGKKGISRNRGRAIQEKAAAEIDDIKKRIRQLGLRVHDITGVSTEGLYLIGRLGVAYIKSGAGSLLEVVESLQADMPELQLTTQEVYKALLARDPSRKRRARSETEKKVSRYQSLAKMQLEMDLMAEGIGTKAEKKVPVDAEIKALRGKLTKARLEFYKTDLDAEKIASASERVNQIQKDLANGRDKVKKEVAEVPSELKNLRGQIRDLNREMDLGTELRGLNEQIRTGEYLEPKQKVPRRISKRLENKQIEVAKKKAEINQLIEGMRPWTTKRVLREVTASAKALAATADISFTLRQNFWQVAANLLPHPVKTTAIMAKSLGAFLGEHSSDKIANSLRNAENAELYDLYDVKILDAGSANSQLQSEVFRGKFIENYKVFGKQNPLGRLMRASSRHSVAIGNLFRTSAFDQFVEDNPNATPEELAAMADYINKSTGIGDISELGPAINYLNEVMFSPKFVASRFQTPWAIVKYRKLPRVRKQIARDMVSAVSTGGLVLLLAALAGADVEWEDPNSADWGKIRAGDTRVDIWGGFQQPARLITRLSAGRFTRDSIRDFDPLEMVGRFSMYKAAPAVTIPLELWTGRTMVGEEAAWNETVLRSMFPLITRDIYDAWREEGVGTATAVGTLGVLGVGVGVYKDSETATRRRIKKLRSKGQTGKGEAHQLRVKWNQENPGNRIVTVK